MKRGKRPRPLLLFYILVAYVLLQFGWWTIHLMHLNDEVNHLQRQIAEMQAQSQVARIDQQMLQQKEKELDDTLGKQHAMIFGEGAVFLALLMAGIFQTRRSFRKEALVAQQQKNFLLSVTHELKSPLASVKLQLETLQKRNLPKEKHDDMLLNAVEDAERLHALVENILLASRIDNHAYQVHPETNNLSSELAGLCERAKNGMVRSHTLVADISDNIVLPFDRFAFHSIFMNLVENAAKYAKPQTEIRVALAKKNETIVLSVADRGPGIPADEKEKIFDRFYRIGNEETRSSRGTGLGLYIVKHLAEAHGWSVRADDREGGGTVFEILIPKL